MMLGARIGSARPKDCQLLWLSFSEDIRKDLPLLQKQETYREVDVDHSDSYSHGVLTGHQFVILRLGTVVANRIVPSSDSQLLNDAIRVISRLLAKDKTETGVRIRLTDQRQAFKSIAFQIFNAKKATKNALYPDLLKLVRRILKQANRDLQQVGQGAPAGRSRDTWLRRMSHYKDLASSMSCSTSVLANRSQR